MGTAAELGYLGLEVSDLGAWRRFARDVLGLALESLEERTLGQVLRERVLNPLGMVDTGFFIPADKAERYARALPNDPVTKRKLPRVAWMATSLVDLFGS